MRIRADSKEPLVSYALTLANLKPKQVRFVILDGSTAQGEDRRYSDYDIVVVRKGLSKRRVSVEDLFGVFNGRIFSGWLVSDDSFKREYLGGDDRNFLWRR